jgi:hypothetical protein
MRLADTDAVTAHIHRFYDPLVRAGIMPANEPAAAARAA